MRSAQPRRKGQQLDEALAYVTVRGVEIEPADLAQELAGFLSGEGLPLLDNRSAPFA